MSWGLGSVLTDIYSSASGKPFSRPANDARPPTIAESITGSSSIKKVKGSSSESGDHQGDTKPRQETTGADTDIAPRPKTLSTRASQTALKPAKPRSTNEGASKNMTVETETVNSIPQAALPGASNDRTILGRGDLSGGLQSKPSIETIRPKKERKKVSRKAPSIASGTGRSQQAHISQSHRYHHHDQKFSIQKPTPHLRFPTMSPSNSSSAAAFLQSYLASRSPSPASCYVFISVWTNYVSASTDISLRKASSKADIFEARVASAVDEANSSDSEETFVYESNPPEPEPRRSRYHSRTPSATSMASLAESRTGLRNMSSAHSSQRAMAGKRSMKFANNPYSNIDNDRHDRNDGTVRASVSRASGGNSMHHHHISRHGRSGASHVSILDNDSPFPPGAKSRLTGGNDPRQSLRPFSPKFATHGSRMASAMNKKNEEYPSYDMDGEGADDERAPLVGTVRTPRSVRAARRPTSASLRQLGYYQRRSRSWMSRFAGCIFMTVMLVLLVCGAVGFLFATTKPLYAVEVREIQNVLASEQEIMLDLLVQAINPNVVAVTVADMDVNIFAKSKYVGTDRWWREHHRSWGADARRRRRRAVPAPEDDARVHSQRYDTLDDDLTDPIEDPERDPQTMLLGRIFHFDSGLSFEGSPLKRHLHYSVGELRLPKPGNKTEAGGTERWERVIQHPFELIVRGILRYQLPLSSHTHTSPIGATIVVHPEEDLDSDGRMRVERVEAVEGREWAKVIS